MNIDRKAFTLIELLVVIAIIAVLIALLLPAVQQVREAARRTMCKSRIKQLALALHHYHDIHRTFPVNASYTQSFGPTARSRSWLQCILPQLEQAAIHDLIDDSASIAEMRWLAELPIVAFQCPSDTNAGVMSARADVPQDWALGINNYKACLGSNWHLGRFVNAGVGLNAGETNGILNGDGLIGPGHKNAAVARIRDVRDGTSQTFAIGETVAGWTSWSWWFNNNMTCATAAIPLNYQPPEIRPEDNATDYFHTYGFMSRHAGGGNFAMVDASARFVSEAIDLKVYRALGTIQGGEVTGEW